MTDEDIKHIDQRAYFITIPLNHIDEIKSTQNVIYTKIRKSFDFRDEDNKIGLILCGDVNGTRTNIVNDLGYQNPHHHGLMFLPKDIAPHTELLEQEMYGNLRSGIGELSEVSRQVTKGNDIYIERYDPKKDSLFQTISYVIKADTNFVSGHADKFNHSTFPYDKTLSCTSRIIDFSNQRTQDLLFKLHLYPEQVLATANPSHLTAWQGHQRGLYEGELGEEDKAKVRSRFLSLIRPATH